MRRVIKFRVWNGTEYLEMGLSPFYGYDPLIDWEKSQDRTDNDNGVVCVVAPDNHDTFVWEQFTGLQDRNGKDIYEGDIVRLLDSHRSGTGLLHDEDVIVHWDSTDLGWRVKHLSDGTDWCRGSRMGWALAVKEVIGNIHEHPHLLKP